MNTLFIRKVILIGAVVLVSCLFMDLIAQCPMCKMSAESNLKAGGTSGKGLNAGILFLLTTPYFIIGTIGVVWWKNRTKALVE